MTEKSATSLELPVRRPQRADARRNFDALLDAAREAFARNGIGASLEDIAQAAGVGIGTLYRNFPTRQALFDSVFVGEVDELCRAADEVASLPPWEAFATWLRRFVDYIATKRAIHEALNQDSEMFRSCRAALVVAGEPLFVRAQKAAAVRSDAGFDDVLRMISGIASAAFVDEGQRERVLGIALDGVRAHPRTAATAAVTSSRDLVSGGRPPLLSR